MQGVKLEETIVFPFKKALGIFPHNHDNIMKQLKYFLFQYIVNINYKKLSCIDRDKELILA